MIAAGLAGQYQILTSTQEKICSNLPNSWRDGCAAGVHDTSRFIVFGLAYAGPDSWLKGYDEALAGRITECGSGAALFNAGCMEGLEAQQ